MNTALRLPSLIEKHEQSLVSDWIQEQLSLTKQRGLLSETDLRQQCYDLLRALRDASKSSGVNDLDSSSWDPVKEVLESVSKSRAAQGFSPSEVATFVFSLKRPLFNRLRQELGKDVEGFATEIWAATELIDKLGLFTTEMYQKVREEVIARQQAEMLELSTPVVKLWEGVLALPLIGTLDSARTQVVMETLLQNIVDTGSTIAIIDITGVPTVDTLVAQHLIKTVTAARLMGADCIISGIRPQIAQTIVHLGVNLGDVITKASLADAFLLALRRSGIDIDHAALTRRSKEV